MGEEKLASPVSQVVSIGLRLERACKFNQRVQELESSTFGIFLEYKRKSYWTEVRLRYRGRGRFEILVQKIGDYPKADRPEAIQRVLDMGYTLNENGYYQELLKVQKDLQDRRVTMPVPPFMALTQTEGAEGWCVFRDEVYELAKLWLDLIGQKVPAQVPFIFVSELNELTGQIESGIGFIKTNTTIEEIQQWVDSLASQQCGA